MYYTLSGTLFTGTKSTFIDDLMLPDQERYHSRHQSGIVADINHLSDLSIVFQFPNVFSSLLFQL
jgi:hypothetical protein